METEGGGRTLEYLGKFWPRANFQLLPGLEPQASFGGHFSKMPKILAYLLKYLVRIRMNLSGSLEKIGSRSLLSNSSEHSNLPTSAVCKLRRAEGDTLEKRPNRSIEIAENFIRGFHSSSV